MLRPSRHVALPRMAIKRIAGRDDATGRDVTFRRECNEQLLFAADVIEHAGKEIRLPGHRAQHREVNA